MNEVALNLVHPCFCDIPSLHTIHGCGDAVKSFIFGSVRSRYIQWNLLTNRRCIFCLNRIDRLHSPLSPTLWPTGNILRIQWQRLQPHHVLRCTIARMVFRGTTYECCDVKARLGPLQLTVLKTV